MPLIFTVEFMTWAEIGGAKSKLASTNTDGTICLLIVCFIFHLIVKVPSCLKQNSKAEYKTHFGFWLNPVQRLYHWNRGGKL